MGEPMPIRVPMIDSPPRATSPRKISLTLLALLVLAGPAARAAAAATIAGWDVSTMPGGSGNFGTSPLGATVQDPHVTVGALTRGSGVGTSGSGAARGWGGNNFTAATQADAITANQLASFTVTATVGFTMSFSSVSTLDYRRSTTGPATGRLQYQVGGGGFVDAAPLAYSSTSASGASVGPIDLSAIAALQNVPPGTTVTFRIVNWGGTGATGTWYVFDRAGSTATDLEVQGTVAPQAGGANPTASGLATPASAALGESVLLEVGVVPGSNPASTGLQVTGDLTALGGGAGVTFHDDGLGGDHVAGDNIFSYQATVGAAIAPGSKTVTAGVRDAQGRTATASIPVRVLGSLTIFHVNDTHARITPHKWIVPSHAPMSSGFEDVGGAAYLATAILQSTAADPNALVIDAGDISEGNPLGDIGGNLSMVQFYDMLSMKLVAQRGRGLDAVVVGNHDVRNASYITNLEDLNQTGVPVISVNVRDIATHQPHFAPYTIVTVNGLKIGILGYTTQSAAVGASLSATLEVADCDWNSTDATKIHLASYVNQLRNTLGCDLVVMATHVGHAALATDTTIDGAVAPALLADDGSAKLPEIAITGHWHTWAETAWQPASLNYKTIFTEAGSYMHYLGELHVDGHGGYVSSVSHPIRDAVYAPDPDVQAFIADLTTQYDASHPIALEGVLGYTADDLLLDERMKWWSSDEFPWSGNNTAGQWIADGMQWKCAQLFGQCDLAVEVGGGVRSDIPAGAVTYTQVYETFPWSDDTFVRVNMTGQEIINFIETTDCDAAFSRALHVTAHDGAPASVTFNGLPIDPAHTYTMGITNFIFDHPPAGWTWSDQSPVTSAVLARDGLVEFMQQFPVTSPYVVGGPRYDLDTQFAGIYRGVVTLMNDNDVKPVFEDAFLRLLSATPETLSRRGSTAVPTNLVNEDGSINAANRLSETELYRSFLGFKQGALVPGDIIEVAGKGGFFGGDPELVDQEGIYGNGVEFKIVGHDDSLAKPAFMSSIGSFWDDNHKNHYVEFLARKASADTVTDQFGTTIKLWDATAFASKTPVPGAVNDLLIVSGVPTSESFSLRFRCATVDLASSRGITGFPASAAVTAQIDPLSPQATTPTVTLSATAGPSAPTRVLSPVADAQVSSGNPNTNSGSATSMFIQSAATNFGNERAWLRFDLSSLPSDAVVTAATLEMYCWKATGPSLDTEVHGGTSDTWGETTITWNNQPAFGPTLATQTLAAGAVNVYYDWDVTSFVQGQLAGDKLVSLLVKPTVEGSTASPSPSYAFDAREFGSTIPVLRVTVQSASATVAQTQFFYRYSADGVTWSAWTSIATDGTAPYSTAFGYPQGYGYYEFYSVATDGSGVVQGAPPAAQASIHYEPAPGYTTAAYVTLNGLAQTYSGAPRPAAVTTVPPGLAMNVTYNGGAAVPVHAGSYAVSATVTQPGYTGTAIGTLNVAPASQSISFGPLSSVGANHPPLTLTGTASSGLPVTFASSNPAVATVSGNVVTIVAVGTTSITATQAGNADVLAAAPVSQPLTVTPAVPPPAVPAAPPLVLLACVVLIVAGGAARRAGGGPTGRSADGR
jgi:2',3'-cyclic-nucleotide 2'-phosphodiesterase (5'-nucleotidase family)